MRLGRLVAIFIGFIIFIVILVKLFTGGGHKAPTPAGPTISPLPDYAGTAATVTFTTDGIINGDDLHRAIRITIGRDSRNLDVIQGYSGRVISSKNFYNTQDAFRAFLIALNNSGFLAKIKNSKAPADETGQCPLGFRYIFDLNDGTQDLSRLWTSSCGTKTGTSAAPISTIQTLFQDQIPDYETLTDNVNLSATSAQNQ